MHIIVLENQPSSQRGGQELILLDVCRGLSERGHRISLLYLEEGDLLQQYQEFCIHALKVNSFILDRTNINNSFRFFADIWNAPVDKETVVYSNRYHDVIFGFLLASIRKVPFVCYLQLPPHTNRFGRMQMLGLKGAKKLIALSQQTKADWASIGLKSEKIDIVHVGIDLEVYKPADDFSAIRKYWHIPDDTKVISYVGRLDREKSLETLIKAFALLVSKGINTKLLIAGKPVAHPSFEEGEKYKNSLKQLAIDLGIEQYISFTGHVNDTTSVYQVSDATVLASLWSEPFGRAIIESMACGTPVVASRTGGIPEILTSEFQSLLFEPGNEYALADTLEGIINWRDQDPSFGSRCREHVLAQFTLAKMVDGIEQVLGSVVNSDGVPVEQNRVHSM